MPKRKRSRPQKRRGRTTTKKKPAVSPIFIASATLVLFVVFQPLQMYAIALFEYIGVQPLPVLSIRTEAALVAIAVAWLAGKLL